MQIPMHLWRDGRSPNRYKNEKIEMKRRRAIDESQRDYCRLFVALTCSRVTRRRFIRAIYFRGSDNPRVATLRQIVRENTIYFPWAARALSANCNFSLIRTVRVRIEMDARTHAYCLQASLAQIDVVNRVNSRLPCKTRCMTMHYAAIDKR